MADEIKLNSIKRFGVRYGRTVKQQFGEIEQLHRRYYKCQFCTKESVKRVTRGIWECTSCKVQFTGKAYTPSKIKMAQITGKEGLEQDLLTPREKEENYGEEAEETQKAENTAEESQDQEQEDVQDQEEQ